jgi:predicted nuclease of predicted toxin-antitoxin system
MKILLDENLPAKVIYYFGDGIEVLSVRDMDWLGKKNGELLTLAEANSFEVFITLDKNLKFQQSIHKFNLKFIVLLAVDNKPKTIELFINKIKAILNSRDIPKILEISLK